MSYYVDAPSLRLIAVYTTSLLRYVPVGDTLAEFFALFTVLTMAELLYC